MARIHAVVPSAVLLAACQEKGQQGSQPSSQSSSRPQASQQQPQQPGALPGSQSAQPSGTGQGAEEATGRITQASASEVVLDRGTAEPLHLKIDSQTKVEGGPATSSADLQPGTEVRAAYEVKDEQPIAKRIEVTSSGSAGSSGAAGPTGSSSGTGSASGSSGSSGSSSPSR